jgi:hypothetical protein
MVGSIARAVAKKARTPPPPRRVQAPQKRDRKRDDRRGGPPRDYLTIKYAVAAAAVALAALAAVLYFVVRDDTPGSSGAAGTNTNPVFNSFNNLPGIRRTNAPWPPEYATLSDRLEPLNLTANPSEQLAYHIHQHLDIFLNGKRLPGGVPPGIGINDAAYITELHTHAADGVIHVEAAENKHYTLGAFFAEWGVFLNSKCVGGYCEGYTWYVNGKRQIEPPWTFELKAHQEIVVAIGKPPKKIPKTYDWAGL